MVLIKKFNRRNLAFFNKSFNHKLNTTILHILLILYQHLIGQIFEQISYYLTVILLDKSASI